MSTTEAQQIVKRYAEKLQAEKYHFSAVYLFGSFVNGVPDEGSDIDVAGVSDEVRKNARKGKSRLWKFAEGVDIRIEPHGFSPEDFKQDWMPMVHEIKKTGIRIR